MAFTHIQGAAGHASASSLTITTSPTTGSSLVVISFYVSNSGQVVSVTDNRNNVYLASVVEVILPNGAVANQYYGVQQNAGTTAITITLGSIQEITAGVNIYTGGNITNATVLDKAVSSSGTGASSSVMLNPTNSGELIEAGVIIFGNSVNPSAGANYVSGGFDQTLKTAFTEFRLNSTTSDTATASWTGSVPWAEIASAFIPGPPLPDVIFTHIQSVYKEGSGTNLIIPLNQAAMQDDLLIINFQFDATGVIGINIADNVGNIYAVAKNETDFAGGTYAAYQYYGVQLTGGTTQVIIFWTGSHNAAAFIDEFKGGMKSNATVFDATASTKGHTDISNTGYGGLTINQPPFGVSNPTYIPADLPDSGFTPILIPSNPLNLVIGAFFADQGMTSQDIGSIYANGYIQNISSNLNSGAMIFTSHKLSANSSGEVPWGSWEPAVNFAIIGGSYKLNSDISGIRIVHKSAVASYYPGQPLIGPIYDPRSSRHNNVSVYVETIPATSQGNLLVINSSAFSSIASITDNVGNTYSKIQALQGQNAGLWLEKWYGVQVTGGATTITVTHSSTGRRQYSFNEYTGTANSNPAVFDKVSTLSGRTPPSGNVDIVNMSVPAFTPSNSGAVIDTNMNHDSELAYVDISTGYEWSAGTGYYILNGSYNFYIDVHLADMYKLSSGVAETAPVSYHGVYSQNYLEIAAAFNASGDLAIDKFDAIVTIELLDASGPYRSFNQFELVGTSESSRIFPDIPYQSDQVTTSENAVVLVATGLILFVAVFDQIQAQEHIDLVADSIRAITISDAAAMSEAISHYSDNIRTSESTSVVISMPLTLINYSDIVVPSEFVDTLRNGARDIYLTDNRLLDQNGNPLLDGFNHFILDQTPGGDLVSTSELINFADKHLDLRVSNLVITKEQVRISTGLVSFIDTVYIPVVIP